MKTRHEIDGTLTLTLEDGRRFTLHDDVDRGTLSIQSVDEDIIILPVSSSIVTIDTPIS
jgi:hypothetical protein